MLKAYSRAVARINSLRSEEEGATAVEYALIIGARLDRHRRGAALIGLRSLGLVNDAIIPHLDGTRPSRRRSALPIQSSRPADSSESAGVPWQWRSRMRSRLENAGQRQSSSHSSCCRSCLLLFAHHGLRLWCSISSSPSLLRPERGSRYTPYHFTTTRDTQCIVRGTEAEASLASSPTGRVRLRRVQRRRRGRTSRDNECRRLLTDLTGWLSTGDSDVSQGDGKHAMRRMKRSRASARDERGATAVRVALLSCRSSCASPFVVDVGLLYWEKANCRMAQTPRRSRWPGVRCTSRSALRDSGRLAQHCSELERQRRLPDARHLQREHSTGGT